LEGWAFFMDGTLGFSDDFFNTWVLTSASSGIVTGGGSIAVTLFNDTSRAIIGSGARINQDPSMQDAEQTVEVPAHTTRQLIEAAGIASINLTPQGAQDALLEGARGISERFLTLFSPISAFQGNKGGIGASVLLDLVNDATTAEVQPGALVHTGVPGEGE